MQASCVYVAKFHNVLHEAGSQRVECIVNADPSIRHTAGSARLDIPQRFPELLPALYLVPKTVEWLSQLTADGGANSISRSQLLLDWLNSSSRDDLLEGWR